MRYLDKFSGVLAIADDLTGALDLASMSLGLGIKPFVYNLFHLPTTRFSFPFPSELQILATNLRYKPSWEIREFLSTLLSEALLKDRLLFLKLDSTARGNLGALITALLDLGIDSIVYSPASPRLRRTVEGGVLYIDGSKLEETHFARDPLSPRNTSRLLEIITSSASRPLKIREVHERELLKGKKNLFAEAVLDAEVIIPDVREDFHLERVVELSLYALRATERRIAFAGSSAFFKAIMKALHSKESKVLFIMGSLNPITREQVETWKVFGGRALEYSPEMDLESFISHALSFHESIVIYTPDKQLQGKELEITRKLGEIGERLITARDWDGLFLCGGEVAWEVLRRMNISYQKPLIPIEPGIPLTQVMSPETTVKYIVTKPGGFGSPDILLKAQDIISSLR